MIRGKILFWSLLLIGAVTAIMGIAQMWWAPFGWEPFIKVLITLLILGTLFSFLIAIDYDYPGSRGKLVLGFLVVLAATGSALILAQLWWQILAFGIFWKILVTMVIITGLLAFIMAVTEDFGTNKKLKDDKYID